MIRELWRVGGNILKKQHETQDFQDQSHVIMWEKSRCQYASVCRFHLKSRTVGLRWDAYDAYILLLDYYFSPSAP